MRFELSGSGDAIILRLEGECTLESAIELQAVLTQGLDKSDKVLVDLEKVSEVDISCLQLLCSALRTSAKMGKQIAIAPNMSDRFARFAKDTGYMYALGLDGIAGDCFQKGRQ
ncbi:MAG: STAS domain-containing protein [Syntrophobacteraceae bacterium]|nr:STAS domain-containing protein [Syntrophobacteraceae bacterium]